MSLEKQLKPHSIYLIGLTGSIACGKSAVVSMLESLGARTKDADQVVRSLQEPGQPVYHQIVEVFGSDFLATPGGAIDRPKLGNLVFRDTEALQRLESIVFPAVHAALLAWLEEVAPPQQAEGQRTIAVIEAIKLLETGWKAHCDAIWVVKSSEAQQVERLVAARGLSQEDALQRIAAQPPQESRIKQADVIIDNSRTLAETRAQVEAAWQQIH